MPLSDLDRAFTHPHSSVHTHTLICSISLLLMSCSGNGNAFVFSVFFYFLFYLFVSTHTHLLLIPVGWALSRDGRSHCDDPYLILFFFSSSRLLLTHSFCVWLFLFFSTPSIQQPASFCLCCGMFHLYLCSTCIFLHPSLVPPPVPTLTCPRYPQIPCVLLRVRGCEHLCGVNSCTGVFYISGCLCNSLGGLGGWRW